MKNVITIAVLSSALFAPCTAQSEEVDILYLYHDAKLVYSNAVTGVLRRKHGPGWTRASILNADSTITPVLEGEGLTRRGGVLFSTTTTKAISPTGRYVVLNVTETESDETTRAYCPILDTKNGCVLRNMSGDVCGGNWDNKLDAWHSTAYSGGDELTLMSEIELPSAKMILQSSASGRTAPATYYLERALGLHNLMACDPPTSSNESYYKQIEAIAGSRGVQPACAPGLPSDAYVDAESGVVKVDRAYLFGSASDASASRGYLIKGDRVMLLGGRRYGFVEVRYLHPGKRPLDAWIQKGDLVNE